ncbi:MAG: accessory Sec system glycosylation chaperone GtfB [Blautia sp.]|nr:accessory Sec system glycosylation chaperone GtfB [Blautia sp.]
MGKNINSDEIVLLFDYYSTDSRDLQESFRKAGYDCPVVVIEEDGFLPDGVLSVFGYFLGSFENGTHIPGRPRYFNQIEVPEYWEISGTNTSGRVHDLGRERGRIFYAEPKHKRLVRVVDWLDDRGVVRSSDHYNRYGALYARTIFNARGQKVNRTYFSAAGREIIMENYVTGDVILNEGEQVLLFHTKTEFVIYFLKKTGYDRKRLFFNSLSTPFFVSQRLDRTKKQDILFWQEPVRDEIPGNMRIILDGSQTRTGRIMVQKGHAYRRLRKLGASPEIVQKLGFVYSFQRENQGRPEALICTNSDHIEHCSKLAEALPQLHFHIAALTEMSSRLLSMERYENVTLYPCVKRSVLDKLFDGCDFYFDINHEAEIVSAVRRAFLHNQLIVAFQGTIHSQDYVAEEHIYDAEAVDRMIGDVEQCIREPELLQRHLRMQRDAALTETTEAYRRF